MQQITLEALESALAPIEAIGKSEKTFDVNGTSVTLRLCLPEEEIASQRYAAEAFKGGNEPHNYDALDYLERFKLAILSNAIIAIGNLNLRDVQTIETGAVLENGTKVKEPKALAMRRLLGKWTQDLRTRMFVKYSELLIEIEVAAEKSIVYEPTDLDTEIDRLEKRLVFLKDERERKNKPDQTSLLRQQVKNIVEQGTQDRKDRQDAVQTMLDKRAGVKPQEETIPENIQASPALGPTRQELFSGAAAPPPDRPVQSAPTTPVQAPQSSLGAPPAPTPPPQERKAPEPPPAWPEDSFVDPGDHDGMMAAINAENQRLLAMRRGQMPPAPSALNMMNAMRPNPTPPPHVQAQAVSEELVSEESQILAATRAAMAAPTEQLGGVNVYRPPAEMVDRRPPANAPSTKVQLNSPGKVPVNPRFKPVKQEP